MKKTVTLLCSVWTTRCKSKAPKIESDKNKRLMPPTLRCWMTSVRMLLRRQRRTYLRSKGISWFKTSASVRSPSSRTRSWLILTTGTLSWSSITSKPQTNWNKRECQWSSMPSASLRKTRRSSFWGPRLTSLKKAWDRLSPTSRKSGSCLNSKTSRSWTSNRRSSKISTSQFVRKIKRALTWNRFARWFWTSDLTSNSSSSSPWSKSRKRKEGSLSRSLRLNRAINNPNSCPWSSQAANSQRRITRVSRRPHSHNRRSQLSLTIWTGRTVRPFSVFSSLRWTLGRQREVGEMRLPLKVVNSAAEVLGPLATKARVWIKIWTGASGTMIRRQATMDSTRSSRCTMMKVTTTKKTLMKFTLEKESEAFC